MRVLAIIPLLLLGLMLSSGAVAQQAPANDDFEQRLVIPPGYAGTDTLPFRHAQETAGATLEPGESAAPCGNTGATVWFEIAVSGEPVTLIIDTAGSEMPTVLAVYTISGFAPSPPDGASLTPLACDAGQFSSRVTIPPQETTFFYQIQVGGLDGQTGTLNLSVDCEPACTPRNDDILTATAVYEFDLPYAEERATSNATLQPGEEQPCAGIGATVWYTFSVSDTRSVTVDTAGSDFDTAVAAYVQPQFLPSPPGGIELVTCNDNNGAGAQSRIAFEARPGVSYYVQAGGAAGATGLLRITIDCAECPIRVISPDSGGQGGGGIEQPGRGGQGSIGGPDTGSGGHAARR